MNLSAGEEIIWPPGGRVITVGVAKRFVPAAPSESPSALVFVPSLLEALHWEKPPGVEALHCGPGPGKCFFLNVVGDTEALRFAGAISIARPAR